MRARPHSSHARVAVGSAARGRPKTRRTTVAARRPRRSTATTRTVTSLAGSLTVRLNRAPWSFRTAFTVPSTETTIRSVPGPAVPAMRPNEAWRGAGATRAGGRRAAGSGVWGTDAITGLA